MEVVAVECVKRGEVERRSKEKFDVKKVIEKKTQRR